MRSNRLEFSSNPGAVLLLAAVAASTSLFGLTGMSGCSSAPPAPPKWSVDVLPMLDGADQTIYRPKLLWKKALPYIVTDLKTSRRAESTFFATIPDPDRRWVPSGYRTFNMRRNGSYRFDRLPAPYKMQIKSLHTSRSGRYLVFGNYRDQIVLLNAAGRKIWEESGNCRPIIIEEMDKVVCYHDDDAEPTIAFTAWGLRRKSVERYPIGGDILSLQVSDSEKWIGLGLTERRLHLLGIVDTDQKRSLKLINEIKLPGEVASLSLSDERKPNSNALSMALLLSQKDPEPILWVGHQGEDGILKSGQLRLSHLAQSAEMSPDGNWVITYSNTKFGQFIFGYAVSEANGKLRLTLRWKRGHPKASDYSHLLQKVPGGVMIGFEQIDAHTRTSVTLAVAFTGELLWAIPLEHNEGAYLYIQDFAPDAKILFTASDDGKFSSYRMIPAKKSSGAR